MRGDSERPQTVAVPATFEIPVQGRYAEAEPLYRRSLAIWEKALGPDHPNVATSFDNYAALLRETGRTAEADEMDARAKAIRDKRAKEKS